MTRYEEFLQFISNFVGGANFDAVFKSISDQLQKQDNLTVAVTNQLTISTASGVYLDKRLSEKGITRPGDLGMDDEAFREMGIAIAASKQITEAVHVVLSTFYGDDLVRAFTTSGVAGPYRLQAGDDLQIVLEDGVVHTLTITGDEFANLQNASVDELVDVITRYIRSIGSNGYAYTYTDQDTGLQYVRIYGGAKGPYSMVQIAGGSIQNELEFPTIRNTFLTSNTTVWEITRNVGNTYRFRWISGPAPSLGVVEPGDSVMIYGPQFETYGFHGTYPVSAARPVGPTSTYDSGYFEIQTDDAIGLASSKPNIAPPVNTPPTFYTYTVTQALYSDLKFFASTKNTPYTQARYALAWEPARSLLKVYMPATTSIMHRNLIGSAHTHMLYPATELNGPAGSSTDSSKQIIIINPLSFKYPTMGGDCSATGGTVMYGANTIDIEYVTREQGFTTVICTQPHGLTGTADSFGIVRSSTVVLVTVESALADDPKHPFLGAYMVDPTANYTLTNEMVTLREPIIAGQSVSTLLVEGTLPNETGNLLFGLSLDTQESPVPYLAAQSANTTSAVSIQSISQFVDTVTVTTISPHGVIAGEKVLISGTVNFNGQWVVVGVPSHTVYTFARTPAATLFETIGTSTPIVGNPITTLIMSTAYIFKGDHAVGEDITLLSASAPYTPAPDGSDYGFYVTGTAEGRIYAESIIQAITALGINLEIIIVYPSDIGLGNAGDSELASAPPPAVSDALYVWGPDAS
jgi:hypothetical protein